MDINDTLGKILDKLNDMDRRMTSIEEDTRATRQDIQCLDEKVQCLCERVNALSDGLEAGFKETRSELVEAVEAVGNKVDALERSIKDVETVTARNTFELQLIKGKA